MSVASMDIKTAFDVAKPTYIAHVLSGQNVHGWLIAALQEMAGLEGEVVPVHDVHRTRERGGPQTSAQDGDADALERGAKLEGKRDGYSR